MRRGLRIIRSGIAGLALATATACGPSLGQLLRDRQLGAAVDYAAAHPKDAERVRAALREALAPGLFLHALPKADIRRVLPDAPEDFVQGWALIWLRYDWNATAVRHVHPGFALRVGGSTATTELASEETLAPRLGELVPRRHCTRSDSTLADLLVSFISLGMVRPIPTSSERCTSDPVPPRTQRLLTALRQSQPAPAGANGSDTQAVSLFLLVPRVASGDSQPLELTVETVVTGLNTRHQISLVSKLPIPAATTFEDRFSGLFAGRVRYLSDLEARRP